MQAVGSIFLERNYSPFARMCLCKQRDAVYCLHENGCVSFRVRSPVEFPQNPILNNDEFRNTVSVAYDTHCHSEPFRISKMCVPYAIAMCPITEMRVGILTSDGKVMFWESLFERVGQYGDQQMNQEMTPLTLLSALPNGDGFNIGEGSDGLTLSHNIAPHWFTPTDSKSHTHFQYNNYYNC